MAVTDRILEAAEIDQVVKELSQGIVVSPSYLISEDLKGWMWDATRE